MPSARTCTYRHVVPGFILMDKPGVWQGNAFIFLTHMRLGLVWNWNQSEVVRIYWISKADQEIGEMFASCKEAVPLLFGSAKPLQ